MKNTRESVNRPGWLVASAAVALAVVGAPVIESVFAVPAAAAQTGPLPKPYVSRAIDATLMEITPEVRSTFGIKPNVSGVLVISTEPRGIASQNNIMPGDVITDVRGKRVKKPIDVDTFVLYFLKKGDSAFQFAGNRGGQTYNSAAEITMELFDAVIDLASLGSWSSYSSESFSYIEYYEEYSEIIVQEYSYSETLIEETVTSETFEEEFIEASYEEEVTSESSTEEMTSENSEEDVMSDEDASADDEDTDDGSNDEDFDDDGAAEDMDDGSDDEASDDNGADEEDTGGGEGDPSDESDGSGDEAF